MTKLGQMLVDDGYKRGKIQGALLCGKTPEEVAEMFDILLQEVLKVQILLERYAYSEISGTSILI